MTDHQSVSLGRLAGDGRTMQPAGYLSLLDFYRVIVCACVLGQHSFIWANMSHSAVGTGFITMLHFTRNAFFLLTGLVVCYAQITRPRTLRGFWIRRYIQLGVPYLAWTAIYVLFTILRPGGAWDQWRSYTWSDLRLGYYQLYVVIVLLQFYLVFPFFLKLLKMTSHHVVILAISVAIALFVGVDLHYNPKLGVVGHDVHHIGVLVPWSRDLLSYQVYFVVGVLLAYHFDWVLQCLARWHHQIVWCCAAVGVGTLVWYITVLRMGASLGSASDIFEPIAVAWSLASAIGLLALSWRWWQRQPDPVAAVTSKNPGSRSPRLRPRLPSITYLAELTGGFFFCHVLFIDMVRAILYSNFVGGTNLPWAIRVPLFYLGTAVVAVAFVALIVRTPLRWVLGGPVRAEQRERDNAEFARRVDGSAPGEPILSAASSALAP